MQNILAEEDLEEFQTQFLNCSHPGAPLGDLPHCCSDAGIARPPGRRVCVGVHGELFIIFACA